MLDKGADLVGRAVKPLSQVLNAVGVSMGLVMVLVVVINVIARNVFVRPLGFTVELTEFMLVILVFFGWGYAQFQKAHVGIDAVVSRFPQKVQAVIDSTTCLLSLGVFSLIIWRSAVLAETFWTRVVLSSQLGIPVAALVLVVSLGSAVLCLALLVDLFNSMSQVVRSGGWLWLPVGGVVALSVVVAPVWLHWLPWTISTPTIAFVVIGILVLLLLSRMLIGSALALVGFLGMASVAGFDAGFGLMGIVPYASTAKYAMCVIPFFVLMGEFCFQAGLSRDLYQTAHKWLGHVRGGLAMATVAACGAFAAVSGSSLATAATMGAVALPEMKRYGYRDTLAAGCIAAGGTVGVLIPPSTILIIYGILTEQSITKLFLAGIFPGLLSVLYYMVTIYITCRISPGLGPAALRSNFRERVVSLKNTWAVLVLFGLVMGGMVGGLFTPTEAGAIGAFGALFFMLIKRRLSGQSLLNSLLETGRTTAMVFLIFIGTMIFGYFLAVTRLPMEFAAFAAGLPIPPFAVFGGILLVYLLLGCIMGVLPMVLLTVPIFYPVVVALGFDPIWFGVMIVMVVEIGLITPPVGMNVFIIKGVAKDIPLPTIFRGVVPFLIADFARVATMMLFPQIALFLPGLVGG